jgi:hypothetical protein
MLGLERRQIILQDFGVVGRSDKLRLLPVESLLCVIQLLALPFVLPLAFTPREIHSLLVSTQTATPPTIPHWPA